MVTKEILQIGDGHLKPKMGSLCRIKYLAYYYDKEIFDSSPADGKSTTDLYVGDIKLIEGLWRGLMEMRVGERAKIRIKKKFAFGRPGEVEKLLWPANADREKLKSKAVIYEVELVQMVTRMDIEANGQMFKQVLVKAERGNFELATEVDEVTVDCEFYQGRDDLFNAYQGETQRWTFEGILQKCPSPLVIKLVESLKKGEVADFTINAGYLNGTQDAEETLIDAGLESILDSWDKTQDLFMKAELKSLVKIEDWYKDESTMVRTLRKGGKGRNPYSDSTVKCKQNLKY